MSKQSSRKGGRSSTFSYKSTNYGSIFSTNYSTNSKTQTPQKPVNNSQTITQSNTSVLPSDGLLGGMGSTIVQGIAYDSGCEIGHQVSRSIMDGHSFGSLPRTTVVNNSPVQQQQIQLSQQENLCKGFKMKFIDCFKNNNNDVSSCQTIFNDLKFCQNSMI